MHRIDNIFTYPQLHALAQSRSVSYSSGLRAKDRYPVLAEFKWDVASNRNPKPNRIRFDQQLLFDPEAVEQFQNTLQAIPLEPWSFEVNEHCRSATEQVLDAANEVCRPRLRTAKKPYVSPGFLGVLSWRRGVQRAPQ
eukprot:3553036-Pyramimonas_sp.AAC.1